MPISIYPPVLKSTQSPFVVDQSPYYIYFTLQKITTFSEIGHIQIRIVKQTNNRSIADTGQYPDGTIYKTPQEIRMVGQEYMVPILLSDLAPNEKWKPGYLYKVQMRFGTTSKFSDVSGFAAWKQEQVDKQTFSEWSTVMIIKSIDKPLDASIINAQAVKADVIQSQRTESTLSPLFNGTFNSFIENKESVNKYKFDLYDGDVNLSTDKDGNTVLSGVLLETSGWLQHNSANDTMTTENVSQGLDSFRFKHILINHNFYTVIYYVETTNGYTTNSAPYYFQASKTYYEDLEGAYLRADSEDIFCKENGCIRLYLTTEAELSGAFVITRTSENSNYQVWEDLQYLIFNGKKFEDALIYEDYTIESGKKYKYAIQQENAAGLRTSPVINENEDAHYVDFEYSYLYHDNIQLRLMFNQKISSWKHTVLTSKQDTLGDKYPHLVKNGNAYYAEFPISGLISLQMDPDRTFFKAMQDLGLAYQNNLAISKDKFDYQNYIRQSCQDTSHAFNPDTGEPIYDINDKNYHKAIIRDQTTLLDDGMYVNSNLTDNNIFIERMFREKVEEFLNNFDYKLYKSPTEGNVVVILTNVSLTPNNTTGRMIYEFSATAYEVMENTLNNLNEFGIINIGEFQSLASDEINLAFGQIRGIYTIGRSTNDVMSLIREQEEISLGGGYKRKLEGLRSFWIEKYPKLSFTAVLTELKAKRAELIKNDESVEEIDAQIDKYNNLEQALQNMELSTSVININGRNILIPPNRIYALEEPVTSLQLVSVPYPIIINYVCELTQQEDESVGVIAAVDTSRVWGQISGVFTTTDKVLKTYKYNYGPGQPPFRVSSRSADNNDKTVIKDKNGNILIDNTNFNLYKTTNLLDIIKEETRKQIEVIYNIPNGFHQDTNGKWTDGKVYYSFTDIILFDIEVDQGTILLVGSKTDGSDARLIKIGPTERYVLNPMDNLVKYIALQEPRFAIINYKCLTQQSIMRG